MKNLLILLTFFMFSCSVLDCDKPTPKPPHGTPDDQYEYVSNDGYKSVTYTYYCHGGQYKSYTYTRMDLCSNWDEDVFTSSGICK